MVGFSIIMPTRNRPASFGRAIESVREQSWPDFEIVVVDDGSSAEHLDAYRAIAEGTEKGRVRWFSLVARPNGHGQSYAVNFGAAQAAGAYLCFLDDDDWWTDSEHLKRAHGVIEASEGRVDLYLGNQAAFLHGKQKPGPIWIEDLVSIAERGGNRADRNGAYAVGIDELMASQGFCHMNALIVRRGLYEQVGGMDETIRWECDRDLYLRLIDSAMVVKYVPATVSRHNIPDPAKASNMTTMLSELERRLFQVRVLDRAALFARRGEIRAHGRRHKAYALKKIAEHLDRMGRHREAAFYAREALGAGPTAKWAGYAAWLAARAFGKSSR